MSINLQKGQKVNLEKGGTALQIFAVGMGWDVNETDSGHQFDLDASVFVLGSNGKCLSNHHFIFYNNVDGKGTASEEGKKYSLDDAAFGVVHSGDNTTGVGDRDDETIYIDISKISNDVQSVNIVCTIHEAETRRQNFGQVRNAFVRVYDLLTNEVILKFDLGEDFSIETAVEFGRIYKKDGQWKFEAIGSGFAGGLQKFVDKYC